MPGDAGVAKDFPGPYVHQIQENDPLMKRVDFPKMDIGARSVALPKGRTGPEMVLEHVSNNKT